MQTVRLRQTLLCCFSLCLWLGMSCEKHSKPGVPADAQEPHWREPHIFILCYEQYPWVDEKSERVLVKELSKIPSLEELRARGKHAGRPQFSISFTGHPEKEITFDAVQTGRDGKTRYYDIRVLKDQVMTELKSVAYSGEDYLSVYHGDTWMMAIGKIDFLREDEEKNK